MSNLGTATSRGKREMETIKVYNRTGEPIILKDYYVRNLVLMVGFYGGLIHRIPAHGDMLLDNYEYVMESLKQGGAQEIHVCVDGNRPTNPPPLELIHENFINKKKVFFRMSDDGRRITHTFSEAEEEADIPPV